MTNIYSKFISYQNKLANNFETITEETNTPIDVSSWTKVGGQLGSNPGGQYHDHNGKKWYVKFSKSDDHAKNEHLAHHIYKAAGAPVVDYHLIHHNGKLGTASEWIDKGDFDQHNPEHVSKAREHFATHALTANWDSVGLAYDNQAPTHKGMTTVDTGGSLLYRAQGEPKGSAWNSSASEFHSLRDPNRYNPATSVFGGMSKDELKSSTSRIAAIPDEHLHHLAKTYGPGSAQDREALGHTLVARKHNIIKYANE